MSEEKDLAGENVHGVKNNWDRFSSWASTPEPEPVEEKPTPAPEPKPEPVVEDSSFDSQTLNKMASHLRKRERLKITLAEAKDRIVNDPEVRAEYEQLKKSGKF